MNDKLSPPPPGRTTCVWVTCFTRVVLCDTSPWRLLVRHRASCETQRCVQGSFFNGIAHADRLVSFTASGSSVTRRVHLERLPDQRLHSFPRHRLPPSGVHQASSERTPEASWRERGETSPVSLGFFSPRLHRRRFIHFLFPPAKCLFVVYATELHATRC